MGQAITVVIDVSALKKCLRKPMNHLRNRFDELAVEAYDLFGSRTH